MDWTKAIEMNKTALDRIVANLVAMVAYAAEERFSQSFYRAVLLVLLRSESAVRRLIVMASRGIVVKPATSRPMPGGLVITGKSEKLLSFKLFDARKRFDDDNRDHEQRGGRKTGPAVYFIDAPAPLVPLFQQNTKPEPKIDMARLNRRLTALKQALETLPRQARRMARWRARRALIKEPKFTSPLRPGVPPGYRKKPREEIDHVLRDCHGLAWDVLHGDTS